MFSLETKNLTARSPVEADAESILKIKNDAEVRKFFPELISYDCTVHDATRFIFYSMRDYNSGGLKKCGEILFPIILRQTGEIIGLIRICEKNYLNEQIVSCFIDSEHSGKGYGFEALTALCDYAFFEYQPKYVVTVMPVEDERGLALAKKSGFHITEKRCVYDECRDCFTDEYYYLRKYNPNFINSRKQ